MKPIRSLLVATTIASLVCCQQATAQSQNDNNTDDLQILVIEGEDGANIVKDQTFAETIVEVRDKNNLPIAGGAAVTFAIVWGATHAGGGSPGTFGTGSNTLSVTADANGRAVMSGFRPQGTGQVDVRIQANYQGHTGKTTVHQTNFPTVAAVQAAGKNVGNQVKSNPSQNASNASNASNSGKAVQAASHGMSTGAKVALITVGAAGAAGGAAYGAGLFNTQKDCSAQANAWVSVLQPYAQACTSSPNSQACITQVNAYLNAANSFCSCVGGFGDVPSQYRQALQDALNQIRQFYGASASAPACH